MIAPKSASHQSTKIVIFFKIKCTHKLCCYISALPLNECNICNNYRTTLPNFLCKYYMFISKFSTIPPPPSIQNHCNVINNEYNNAHCSNNIPPKTIFSTPIIKSYNPPYTCFHRLFTNWLLPKL